MILNPMMKAGKETGFLETMSALSGKHIACQRGERLIFRGLNFSLESGEALVLLGPNGSGKTSLLRLIAGFIMPVEGVLSRHSILVKEHLDKHQASLHYLDYRNAVKPALNVMENLAFAANLRRGATRKALQAALEQVGLAAFSHDPARMLSSGQLRRLALARLLVTSADLWLLDEPTTALDIETSRWFETVIASHRRRGGCVVIATHSEMRIGQARPLYLDRYAPES